MNIQLSIVVAAKKRVKETPIKYYGKISIYAMMALFALTPYSLVTAQDVRTLEERSIIHIQKGDVLAGSRKYKLAIAQYTEAIRLNPNDLEPYLGRALAYARRGFKFSHRGHYRRAVRDAKKAMSLSSNNPKAYYTRGLVYFIHGKYKHALSDFNAAISIDEQYAKAYANRGELYVKRKEYLRAIEDFDRAIDINDELVGAYINRGLSYDNIPQPRYDKSIADYTKALELEPRNGVALYNRGIAHILLGQTEKDDARKLGAHR